uniref:Uncharacterized protein n=1 Tax=Opuntia streptacantha TaxID=393608 RepID=A0A7C9ASF7_OPUST
MIFVITFQSFDFHILIKRSIDITATFHIKLKIIKGLLPCRFVIHIHTLNIIHMMTFKQLLYSALNNSTLHLVLELFTKNPIKFLYIMLHERIICVPSKRFG